MTKLTKPTPALTHQSSTNGFLTEMLKSKLANSVSSPEFDLLAATIDGLARAIVFEDKGVTYTELRSLDW